MIIPSVTLYSTMLAIGASPFLVGIAFDVPFIPAGFDREISPPDSRYFHTGAFQPAVAESERTPPYFQYELSAFGVCRSSAYTPLSA